jgi:hypothetical protein
MPVVAVERSGAVAGLEQATWRVATLDDLSLTPRGEVIIKGNPTGSARPA